MKVKQPSASDTCGGEVQGLKVYPSAANFLLIRTATPTGGRPMVEAMGRQGFYLRDLSEFPALGSSYFRVAVRMRKENQRLIEAIQSCVIASPRPAEATTAGSLPPQKLADPPSLVAEPRSDNLTPL